MANRKGRGKGKKHRRKGPRPSKIRATLRGDGNAAVASVHILNMQTGRYLDVERNWR